MTDYNVKVKSYREERERRIANSQEVGCYYDKHKIENENPNKVGRPRSIELENIKRLVKFWRKIKQTVNMPITLNASITCNTCGKMMNWGYTQCTT